MSPASVGCLLAAATPHPALRDEVLAAIDAELEKRERIYQASRSVEGRQ
jgi:hypothetical protein